jgi:hypothetical protein
MKRRLIAFFQELWECMTCEFYTRPDEEVVSF